MGQQTVTAARVRGPRRRRSYARFGTSLLLAALLGGCKIIITVPPGGQVMAGGELQCQAGETCEIDVATTSFDREFTAEPAPGMRFAGWRSGSYYLCGGQTTSCRFTSAGFAGVPELEALLDNDEALLLEPVFEPADTARYDVDAWAALLGELDDAGFRSNAFLFDVTPNTANCDPGVLSAAARERFLYTVNLLRQLHYLPPVEYLTSFGPEQQQTALVQLANNYLTHYPSPSDTCYSAAAASGAGSSNLSYRSSQGDPAYYPLGWVNDNYNISSLMEAGHRRWVLYPQLGYTSYGQARGYASMKVFGFGRAPGETVSPEVEYVAMPYRTYPWVLVSRGSHPTPWSISMVPPAGVSSRFDHFSGATVSVVVTATDEPLTVHSEHSDTRGYGLANFFSWMVDDWDYDTPYTVTIDNIAMPDGTTRSVQYPVEIDRAELL